MAQIGCPGRKYSWIENSAYERKKFFVSPPSIGQITDRDGPIIGRIPQSNSELRTGVEKGPRTHRAPTSFPSFPKAKNQFKSKGLLGTAKMPKRNPGRLSGVGIQAWSSLLVHQWHDLPWEGSG